MEGNGRKANKLTIPLNKGLHKVHINRVSPHKFNQYTTKQTD